MPRKPTPEEPEYYKEKMPNGWAVNLYDEHLAKQDVSFYVTRLQQALQEIPKMEKQLRKAMHRASKFGDLSDEQLYYLTQPVHEQLSVMGGTDIFSIVQEEEEQHGPS